MPTEHLCSSRNSDEAGGKHTNASQMKGRLVQMFQTSGRRSAFMWSRTGSLVARILSEQGAGSWKRTREECPQFTVVLSTKPHQVNREKNDPTVTTQFFQTQKEEEGWVDAVHHDYLNEIIILTASTQVSEVKIMPPHLIHSALSFCIIFKYLPWLQCLVQHGEEEKTCRLQAWFSTMQTRWVLNSTVGHKLCSSVKQA